MSVRLGDRYKDSATGYLGIATTRSIFLGGYTLVKLERLTEKNGIEEYWFPENRLMKMPAQELPGDYA